MTTEYSQLDAPPHMNNSEASAWAQGANYVSELNNAERESLLAEHAMMREALQDVCNCNPTINFTKPNAFKYVASIEKARKALSTKPRLVEVAKVTNNGSQLSLTKPDGSYWDMSKHIGDVFYTIQTDTKSEAKRKAIQRGE